MKKFILIAVVFVLSIFNVVGALAQLESGASCQTINCGSYAQCGPGEYTSTGCNLTCPSGEIIICPMKNEND
jgi:hypothetical protein